MGLFDRGGWTNGSAAVINVSRTWKRPCNPDLLGIALYRMSDMMYSTTSPYKWQVLQSQVDAVRALRIPFARIYDIYGETFGKTEGSADAFNEAMRRLCYALDVLEIPRAKCSICYDKRDDSAGWDEDDETTDLSDKMVAATDLGFTWHEVDNEPYSVAWNGNSRWDYSPSGQAAYVEYQGYVWEHVHAARPHARVGIAVQRNHTGNVYWGSNMISASGTNFDWVHCHWYQQSSLTDLQRLLSPEIHLEISRLKTLYDNTNNKYGINAGAKLALTEWGVDWQGTGMSDYANGMPGIVAKTAFLLYVHDEFPHLAFMTDWALWQYHTEPAKFRFLSPKSQQDYRTFNYWLFYMLRRYWGDHMLSIGGVCPQITLPDRTDYNRTSLLVIPQASFDADEGCINVIAINLSAGGTIPLYLKFDDWYVRDCSGWLMRFSDWTAPGVISDKSFPVGYLLHRVQMRDIWSGIPAGVEIVVDAADKTAVVELPPLSILFLKAYV